MRQNRQTHQDRGITLIELIVAMALFALVAVMGLQALNGMLRSQGRLVGQSQTNAALSLTLALLRQDLAAALPVLFYTPSGVPVSALSVTRPGPQLALSLGGQAAPATPDFTGFHRVTWHFDQRGQRLMRQAWPALQPASGRQQGPMVEMLTGVSGFDVRLYEASIGWRDWEDLPPEQISSRLPDAIEVTLQIGQQGQITLIEAFR